MKKILIFMFSFLFFTGCTRASQTYQFAHPVEEIECIELIYNNISFDEPFSENRLHLIKTLEEKENIVNFMNDIYALKTKRGHPPSYRLGYYIAKVIYSNGDIELLGSYNIEFVESGGKITSYGSYYFPGDHFEDVFFKYVDKSELPIIE